MQKVLVKLRNVVQWLLVAALAVVVGRFAWVAVEPRLLANASPPEVEPASPGLFPLVLPTRAKPPKQPKVVGGAINLLLMARHRVANSAVYVNGELLGRTTFMRDFSCQRGEELLLQVVPAEGKTIEKRTRCQGETLSISDVDDR